MRTTITLVLAFLFLLTSCQTPQQNTEANSGRIDCSQIDRLPSSGKKECAASTDATAAGVAAKADKPKTLDVTNVDLTPREMAELWQPLDVRREFSRMHDDVFWASLIGIERLQQAKMSDTEPVLMFGEETSYNWMSATRRLNDIPVGSFKLNDQIVSEVNRDIISAFDTHLRFLDNELKTNSFQYPNRMEAKLNKALPIAGGTFRRNSLFNLGNIYRPVTEAEFQNITSNQAISGIRFWQMPWSREGKRYMIFRYPPRDVSAAKRKELYDETNARIEAIRRGESKEDPIDLAAEFQWRFVQIHPMVNGNGRTSRGLMNRILREFGLPPCSRRMIDVDYTLSLQEQKDLVRQGVIESLRLATDQPLPGRISAFRRGFGNRLTTKEIKELTDGLITEEHLRLSDIAPLGASQIFDVKGNKYTLGDDLMFIDRFGVPNAIRYENGRYELFPLTDKTYILYGFGGRQNGVKGLKRDLSEGMMSAVRGNIAFLRDVSKDPAVAQNVKINKYETIEKANNINAFQFYVWQVKHLLEVTKIVEDPVRDPMGVLVQNRGHKTDKSFLGRTYVEKDFFSNATSTVVPEIIGHYMRADQLYYELRKHIENPTEDFLQGTELQRTLLKQLDESRAKLHRAAKVLLTPFTEKIANLNSQDRAFLMNHPQFRLVYEYYQRTPLAYDSLAEAGRHMDLEKTVVLRSAASTRVRLTGFMSDRQVKEAILGVPFVGKRFEDFVRNVKSEIKRQKESGAKEIDAKSPFFATQTAKFAQDNESIKNAVNALLEYIFVDPNAYRSLDPEMARSFVTQYLHTQEDKGPKHTLSTTTDPVYLLNAKKDGSGNFEAKFAWQDATIYIIEVPRQSVQVDIASGYVVQMEVGMQPMSPIRSARAIRFKLVAEEGNVYSLPKAPTTERAKEVMQLMFELPVPQPPPADQGRWIEPANSPPSAA